MITENRAPSIVQSEEGATYDAMLNKKALTEVNMVIKMPHYHLTYLHR